MEKTVIKYTVSYLVARDIWLLLLVCIHMLVSLGLFSGARSAVLCILGAGTVLWILLYSRLLKLVFRLRKDNYINQAFKDEYFSNMRLKAGLNAYTCMIAVGIIIGAAAVVSDLLSAGVKLPVYIACEIIILSGIVTDDTSKILMLRG